MNKQELIETIALETGETKATTTRFLDALINTVQAQVAAGEKVSLVGFGSFEAIGTAARNGRNPATGELLKIEATTRPRFTPGAAFKALVRK
jgi:DNA-binding protein HU-beta